MTHFHYLFICANCPVSQHSTCFIAKWQFSSFLIPWVRNQMYFWTSFIYFASWVLLVYLEFKILQMFVTLTRCKDIACKNFTRIKHGPLCEVKMLSEGEQEKQCRCAIHMSWQKTRALHGVPTITAWAWQNIPVAYVYGFSGKQWTEFNVAFKHRLNLSGVGDTFSWLQCHEPDQLCGCTFILAFHGSLFWIESVIKRECKKRKSRVTFLWSPFAFKIWNRRDLCRQKYSKAKYKLIAQNSTLISSVSELHCENLSCEL